MNAATLKPIIIKPVRYNRLSQHQNQNLQCTINYVVQRKSKQNHISIEARNRSENRKLRFKENPNKQMKKRYLQKTRMTHLVAQDYTAAKLKPNRNQLYNWEEKGVISFTTRIWAQSMPSQSYSYPLLLILIHSRSTKAPNFLSLLWKP